MGQTPASCAGSMQRWSCGHGLSAAGPPEDGGGPHAGAGTLPPPQPGVRLVFAAILHRLCGEVQAAYARADAATLLAAEQGIAQWFAGGTILRGWAVAAQGQAAEGIAQIHQGLVAWRAAWAEVLRPSWLALLAEAYAAGDDPASGLHGLAEALVLVETTGERWYEAELYRLRGELVLAARQSRARRGGSLLPASPRHCPPPASQILGAAGGARA